MIHLFTTIQVCKGSQKMLTVEEVLVHYFLSQLDNMEIMIIV
jgi:hypothetical protein